MSHGSPTLCSRTHYCNLLTDVIDFPLRDAHPLSCRRVYDAVRRLSLDSGHRRRSWRSDHLRPRHLPGDFVTLFTGLPRSTSGISAGFYAAGTTIDFGMFTVFSGSSWALSNGTDPASVTAFSDTDNSLGLCGSIIRQTAPNTWVLNLDDAQSFQVDDDDNDILIQLRVTSKPIAVVPEPATGLCFCRLLLSRMESQTSEGLTPLGLLLEIRSSTLFLCLPAPRRIAEAICCSAITPILSSSSANDYERNLSIAHPPRRILRSIVNIANFRMAICGNLGPTYGW